MENEWNKQKDLETAKIRMLMDDFDNGIFLDETGDFKYTNPDVKAVIRCDDVNHMGNATQNKLQDHLETIHGFNTEDLIELQNIKLTEDTPEFSKSQSLENSVSSSASPTRSQPRHERQTSFPADVHLEHKHQAKSFRGRGRQYRHPLQQQGIQQPHGLVNRPPPPFQVPYWSPTEPPPRPFSNQYVFSPGPPHQNPQFRHGYSHNGSFQNGQVYTGAFNPQDFQRMRPSALRFHSTNVFKK